MARPGSACWCLRSTRWSSRNAPGWCRPGSSRSERLRNARNDLSDGVAMLEHLERRRRAGQRSPGRARAGLHHRQLHPRPRRRAAGARAHPPPPPQPRGPATRPPSRRRSSPRRAPSSRRCARWSCAASCWSRPTCPRSTRWRRRPCAITASRSPPPPAIPSRTPAPSLHSGPETVYHLARAPSAGPAWTPMASS